MRLSAILELKYKENLNLCKYTYPNMLRVMNITLLRQFWSSLESIHPKLLVSLDDRQLDRCLIDCFRSKYSINSQQVETLSEYIQSKRLLIRDLAQTQAHT